MIARTGADEVSELFTGIEARASRHLVFPLNRDECLWLTERVRVLEAALRSAPHAREIEPGLLALAREVIERDLTDPLWPCLTESDWDSDAKLLAGAVLNAASALAVVEQEREAMTATLFAANELERWVRNLDNALAECDAKAEKVADHPDGEEWVGSYYLKCGPWHRVLGCRSQLAWALTNWRDAALAVPSSEPAEEQADNR